MDGVHAFHPAIRKQEAGHSAHPLANVDVMVDDLPAFPLALLPAVALVPGDPNEIGEALCLAVGPELLPERVFAQAPSSRRQRLTARWVRQRTAGIRRLTLDDRLADPDDRYGLLKALLPLLFGSILPLADALRTEEFPSIGSVQATETAVAISACANRVATASTGLRPPGATGNLKAMAAGAGNGQVLTISVNAWGNRSDLNLTHALEESRRDLA